jgi:hypothetical protein
VTHSRCTGFSDLQARAIPFHIYFTIRQCAFIFGPRFVSPLPDWKAAETRQERSAFPTILLLWKVRESSSPGQRATPFHRNDIWGVRKTIWLLKLPIQLTDKTNEISSFTFVVDNPRQNELLLVICSLVKKINKIWEKLVFTWNNDKSPSLCSDILPKIQGRFPQSFSWLSLRFLVHGHNENLMDMFAFDSWKLFWTSPQASIPRVPANCPRITFIFSFRAQND